MKIFDKMFRLSFCVLFVFIFSSCTVSTSTSTVSDTSGTVNMVSETTISEFESSSDVITSTSEDLYSVEGVSVPYIVVNNNEPMFLKSDFTIESFESYSELDSLGRCGVAYACLSKDTMPAENEKRGAIGSVKPSGWHTVKYPEVIKDMYLYNRCHLIGWQLGAENANSKNLITGTRYLNVTGMLPFEDQVSDYIKSTGNHVLYRVTPVYEGNNLVANGVLMEAQSVEDITGCVFCVFCYNIQPGIEIDYASGDSVLIGDTSIVLSENSGGVSVDYYILNSNTGKLHDSDCGYAPASDSKNYVEVSYSEDILDEYDLCRRCLAG